MGCASRKGKMRQHSALKPKVGDKCTACGDCIRHCPVNAITMRSARTSAARVKRSAYIDSKKCIGCAECVVVCRFDAVQYDWDTESHILQKSMAEHAKGALKGKENRAAFFNYLISVTADCDCFNNPDLPEIVEDIGIVASVDPVAVDKASLDLVEQAGGKKIQQLIEKEQLNPLVQIEHAQRIGLGITDYKLIEV